MADYLYPEVAAANKKRALKEKGILKEKGMTKANIAKVKQIFNSFDKDKNGYIDCQELYAALQGCGEDVSKEGVVGLMKELDVNGDGTLEFVEFLAAADEFGLLKSM